jgi:hypothetical protein
MMIPGLVASNSNSTAPTQAGSRSNFLQNLKNAQLQKRSQNFTFEKVKETYKTTELEGESSKKPHAALFGNKGKQNDETNAD